MFTDIQKYNAESPARLMSVDLSCSLGGGPQGKSHRQWKGSRSTESSKGCCLEDLKAKAKGLRQPMPHLYCKVGSKLPSETWI